MIPESPGNSDSTLDAIPLVDPSRPPPHATPEQWAEHWLAVKEAARQRYLAQAAIPRERVYMVPRRFNILSILVMTTVFAIGFAVMRYCNSPIVVYLYVGAQATFTMAVQMWRPDAPRRSSILVGAILFPGTLLVSAFLGEWRLLHFAPTYLCVAPFLIGVGASIGYAMGTFAAGVFLIVDKLDVLLQRKPATATNASPFKDDAPARPVPPA